VCKWVVVPPMWTTAAFKSNAFYFTFWKSKMLPYFYRCSILWCSSIPQFLLCSIKQSVIDFSSYSRTLFIWILIIWTLHHLNSSDDCSIGVFITGVCCIRVVKQDLYINQWASFIQTNSLIWTFLYLSWCKSVLIMKVLLYWYFITSN